MSQDRVTAQVQFTLGNIPNDLSAKISPVTSRNGSAEVDVAMQATPNAKPGRYVIDVSAESERKPPEPSCWWTSYKSRSRPSVRPCRRYLKSSASTIGASFPQVLPNFSQPFWTEEPYSRIESGAAGSKSRKQLRARDAADCSVNDGKPHGKVTLATVRLTWPILR
jgi:hypothetical protein